MRENRKTVHILMGCIDFYRLPTYNLWVEQ